MKILLLSALLLTGCATLKNPTPTDDRIVRDTNGDVIYCSYFDGEPARDPNCIQGFGCRILDRVQK